MTSGVYAIVNKINGKRYVGKSNNIERRWSDHIRLLRKDTKPKDCNRHLYSSFKKYGENNFGFEYLESFDVYDDALLSEAELFWIDLFGTLNRDFGYNLRLDTRTKCIVSQETRDIISENNKGNNNPNFNNKWSDYQKQNASEIAKKLHQSGVYSSEETRIKHSESSKKFWKENPDKKESMGRKVSEIKSKFYFEQYTKSGEFVKRWNSISEIKKEHPNYHVIAIYSCCNGHKKTYRGFVWKKFPKI